MKKVLSVIILFTLIFSLVGCDIDTTTDDSHTLSDTTSTSSIDIENTSSNDTSHIFFVFGQYEQDGNSDNGAEPIEWIVLKEDGNKKLLISRYILDYQEFNDTTIAQGTSWKNSTLRKWLNNDFLNLAFSSNEQKQIVSSKVQDYKADNVLGDITTDKVFLLNKEQAFTLFSSDHDRATTSTNYAKSRKSYVTNGYWLINSYSSDLYKYLINEEGVNENNPRVNESEGIRPVIWINN